LKLEIEPGTFLVANAGTLLTSVQDIVSTGAGGHEFIKLDSGMTEVVNIYTYIYRYIYMYVYMFINTFM
jgi:diaminopimelate decarboxylase